MGAFRDGEVSSEPAERLRGLTYRIFVALILVFALITRLWTLDTSTTHDTFLNYSETEATNLETLRRYLTLEYLRAPEKHDPALLAASPHLCFPGYYALHKAYLTLLPVRTHAAVRAFSALLSLLVVALLLVIGARHIGREGAVVAGLVAATSPLLQYHGSYIRFYAALIFFSAWALLAVMDLAEGRRLPPPGRRRVLRLCGVSLLLWLPLSIHASGALALFVGGVALALRVPWRLRPRETAALFAFNLLLAIPIGLNAAVFVHARAANAELMPSMASSALSFLASLAFNFNGLIFLTIAFALLVCRPLPRLYLYAPFATALALIFAAVLAEPTLFRPDYLLSLLPLTCLLFADAVHQLWSWLGETPRARAALGLLVACVISFTLPTFVSNVWIDQDRFDYSLALDDLHRLTGSDEVLVYSHSPVSFPEQRSGRVHVAHLRDEKTLDETPYGRVFYVIGWRREGFRKTFLAGVDTSEIQRTAHLAHISGRNRLDARDNLLFFFEKAASPVTR